MTSCETDQHSSSWVNENSLTISQYLNKNQHEYSKSYRLLVEGKMLNTLYAYNPNGDNQLIKINNLAPIIKPNLEMTNGYIHVISEVLNPVDISGYDWLQQQNQYSILAQAMEISGIKKKLKWNKYTLFAEPDSIYRRYGIKYVEDLINRIATPGIALTTKANAFYQFTSYHILDREYFMNDLKRAKMLNIQKCCALTSISKIEPIFYT